MHGNHVLLQWCRLQSQVAFSSGFEEPDDRVRESQKVLELATQRGALGCRWDVVAARIAQLRAGRVGGSGTCNPSGLLTRHVGAPALQQTSTSESETEWPKTLQFSHRALYGLRILASDRHATSVGLVCSMLSGSHGCGTMCGGGGQEGCVQTCSF